ncbi:MAG TPA: response regulator, partial [Candidatus Saccharimonadales bacterium]|nr:response regulator [Candidatus Saccharimonadales bacterium]
KPRILIVDDDEMVRFVVRAVLGPAGFEVCEAASGEEAIEKFSSSEGPFPLVLMDMFMPGMNGPEALVLLRQMNSGTKLVLLSGAPDLHSKLGEAPGVTFCPKPFLNDELVALVHQELGLPPGAGS